MHISDFDYELPPELIAQQPLAERTASRMLVVDRAAQTWSDSQFTLFPEYLKANDALVINNTRVFPARLAGERAGSGGAVELLLVREIEANIWETLARPARRLRKGSRIVFGGSRLQAEVIELLNNGRRLVKFASSEELDSVIDDLGKTPLPPYIRRGVGGPEDDKDRYQTIYASQRGAIAAPTAGLHFTPKVLDDVKARGVSIAEITLHVGYGTFEPVRTDDVGHHRVAPEWSSISDEAAQFINDARTSGGRVVAVGTTTTRALESAAGSDHRIERRTGLADLTIVPGYEFRAVDTLLTNFHLPRSSLLMLVSAFAGRDLILSAYRHAVTEGYRFYSYGDCMLIL
ncbi:MAG: S-adenosylmethionine:tRNA ribosyltransferase-isomerase [Blastocatellia bacterium]|jgi:S-adenosylmethionine:tRNA ribosyltransferase-isomerase|nr:S-adenosylmethionine:tRNA ribosyltransferase-isomerase [Blastocatellia bacterium]